MKTVLALRHLQFENLGNLEPVLVERGYRIEYIDATVANLKTLDVLSPDLMFVLGGPIGAFDDELYPFVIDEVALVKARLDSQRPLLGICLGAQFIARVLGANVYSMGHKEIGFGALQLSKQGRESPLAALSDTPVLHWHGDQFDIPQGATLLASSSACPHQAFAYGRNVLALQFHLEADARLIEQWLVGHACEIGLAGIDPRELRLKARSLGQALTDASHTTINAWLDQLASVPVESVA